ncbi:MAG: hypothetical protein ACKON8_01255 [Planctomycetota bacterium]
MACIVGSLASPAALAQTGTPLTLNFSTQSLGTFPTVSGSTYVICGAACLGLATRSLLRSRRRGGRTAAW